MTWLWISMIAVGQVLSNWAYLSLPKGTTWMPVPPVVKTRRGPYRYLSHPAYVGDWLTITALAGLAAGIWNALALGLLTRALFVYWAGLERQ